MSRARDSSSFDRLRAYLEARGAFSPEDIAFMKPLFLPKSLGKGEFFQRAGEKARHAVFVAEGCLRSYVIEKGKEQILQFAPEEWWLSDTQSLMSGEPTAIFIDAIEDSKLLLLEPASHQRILAKVPAYASAFSLGLQRHAAAKDKRIVSSLTASAEERYLEFVARYPSILARVPQWMLASYLGVSPETLSRVRKKLASKARARS